MSGQEPTDPVKGAARTLALFEVFARTRTPLSLTELAQQMKSPISSCHALVRTLQARGYLYVLDERKRVYPTKRLAVIAQAIAAHDPVIERLAPILRKLQQTTGETVLMGKRQGDAVTYLEVIEGGHTIRYTAQPGDTKPLHSSAIGKAMLGALDERECEDVLGRLKLPRVTDRTITRTPSLRADIAAGRKRGYFVTTGENVSDVMALAIARQIGDQPYGIAIAGPIPRVEARRDDCVAALLEAGAAVDRLETRLRGAA